MPNQFSRPADSDLLSQRGDPSGNPRYGYDVLAAKSSSGETTSAVVSAGGALFANELSYPEIKREEWSETAQHRWEELLGIRASGRATMEENLEFEKLQILRRQHDASEEKTDLPAVWAKLQQDKKIVELLKEYANRAPHR